MNVFVLPPCVTVTNVVKGRKYVRSKNIGCMGHKNRLGQAGVTTYLKGFVKEFIWGGKGFIYVSVLIRDIFLLDKVFRSPHVCIHKMILLLRSIMLL